MQKYWEGTTELSISCLWIYKNLEVWKKCQGIEVSENKRIKSLEVKWKYLFYSKIFLVDERKFFYNIYLWVHLKNKKANIA